MNNLAMCHTMTYNSDQTSELVKFFFLSNCAWTHQGAVIGALEHLRLDSCLLIILHLSVLLSTVAPFCQPFESTLRFLARAQ